MFEELIASHCSPALAGIKPANIVTCRKSVTKNIHHEITRLNNQLNSRNIYIEILYEKKDSVLVMVYRQNILNRHLANPLNRAFLMQYGYDKAKNIEDYLDILKSRIKSDDFPHEIGVFLGYPLHDIYCFFNHRNEGCLLVGDWKVYHNAEETVKLFSRFRACKNAVLKKIADGHTLAQIFCAA